MGLFDMLRSKKKSSDEQKYDDALKDTMDKAQKHDYYVVATGITDAGVRQVISAVGTNPSTLFDEAKVLFPNGFKVSLNVQVEDHQPFVVRFAEVRPAEQAMRGDIKPTIH